MHVELIMYLSFFYSFYFVFLHECCIYKSADSSQQIKINSTSNDWVKKHKSETKQSNGNHHLFNHSIEESVSEVSRTQL